MSPALDKPAQGAKLERIEVSTERDLSRVRRAVSTWASTLGLGRLSKTRLVTAASELGRNMLTYGGGGTVHLDTLRRGGRMGLRATFSDSGPGIADPELAFADGFSSGEGLGLGLGGARRLADEFHLETEDGHGTIVSVVNWQGG